MILGCYAWCYYHIRDLRHICWCLPLSIAKYIASALVTSTLDLCNSLFHNIAIKDVPKLQRIQNCIAMFVTRNPPYGHSKPLLKSLHWLPVR